jgi:hypothetical protein
MQTQKSNFVKPASSATALEVADNLMEGFVPAAERVSDPQQTSPPWEAVLSIDNPHFHNVEGVFTLNKPGHWIHLPLCSYSPDLHQVIEHLFGQLKRQLVNDIYAHGNWDAIDMAWLRQWVLNFCQQITPAQIKRAVKQMPDVYRVVAADCGTLVQVGQQCYEGVQGGWPAKGLR